MNTEDKRYCVYVHETIDGDIFYVGSGTLVRANTKESRNSKINLTNRGVKYSHKVKDIDYNYNVRILKENLYKNEAIEFEYETYHTFKEICNLTNSKQPSKERFLDVNRLRQILEYDESSPSCLRWKTDIYCGNVIQVKSGDVAGWFDRSGYYKVSVDGFNLQGHRVVATLCGIDVTGKLVDHIDGNKQNNKITNLRAASFKENSRNRKVPKTSTTGISGICLRTTGNHVRYVVQWFTNDGKRKSKSFNINNYSDIDQAFTAAKDYRLSIVKSLGNYSENHGVNNGI